MSDLSIAAFAVLVMAISLLGSMFSGYALFAKVYRRDRSKGRALKLRSSRQRAERSSLPIPAAARAAGTTRR